MARPPRRAGTERIDLVVSLIPAWPVRVGINLQRIIVSRGAKNSETLVWFGTDK